MPSHPVSISVSEIRAEIWRAAGATIPQRITSPLVGTIFHEVAAELIGPDPARNWTALLDKDRLAGANAAAELAAFSYEKHLGPRLAARRAALAESGKEVLDLWAAARELCRWLVDVLRHAERNGRIRFHAGKWTGIEKLVWAERGLSWEVQGPGWPAPVIVTGVADAVWRDLSGRWCVLELKLGQSTPEADLAQACLYHSMLMASTPFSQARDSALALLWFLPEVKLQTFRGEDVSAAQQRLIDLIGQMAARRVSGPPPRPQPVATSPEVRALGERIVRQLEHFHTPVSLKEAPLVGPGFVRYWLVPGRGVSTQSVIKRAADLQVHLGLAQPLMISVAGGRLVVDVERPDRQPAYLGDYSSQLPPSIGGCSRLPVGVDLEGNLHTADLSDPGCAHLLVAGTTGSGKSEWLRTAIAGLMHRNTPETIRFMLIDPKRVALADLKGSPYLLDENGLLFPGEHDVAGALDHLREEMEARYRSFEAAGADCLDAFQAATGKTLPRIVVVCDEYGDLVADRAASKAFESAIRRLGAKARAAGIHLILATQRPSRDIVSGVIKANLGGRVCLKVFSEIESRLVLDKAGAGGEKLLGRGDLLFASGGEPVRLQGLLLSEADRARFRLHYPT